MARTEQLDQSHFHSNRSCEPLDFEIANREEGLKAAANTTYNFVLKSEMEPLNCCFLGSYNEKEVSLQNSVVALIINYIKIPAGKMTQQK